ncbi:MAG: EFR1 family ferrodoxin [Bacteroidales bacterium]|nr:EFR1 family ferrodoxin [Bacteroidales bacterium]
MKYDQLIIYYFSGTGNAHNAAKWIAGIAEQQEIETHVINIDRFDKIELPKLKGNTLIGFCSPTHGFNMPPILLRFLFRFPRVKNARAFILNTRGGLKLHKLFFPGLSGIAQIFPALILRFKGIKIVGMQPLDLPSNWLILHPGIRHKVVESIHERCKRITENFGRNILSGKRKYKALLSLPIDIAMIPISLGYYFFGRFIFAKTLIASPDCNNCELCVKHCPVNAIKTVQNRPFWTYKCESCMRCANICPHRAIETSHGFVAIVVTLSSLLISPFLLQCLMKIELYEFFRQSFLTGNIWMLIESAIFIFLIILCYRIMHFMMQFAIVRKFFTFTSLSKLALWRRYKSPKEILKG